LPYSKNYKRATWNNFFPQHCGERQIILLEGEVLLD